MEKFKKIDEQVENARLQLKKEFFGIDEQIDSIIENIKPWLCFPEVLTRPTIINLWGLTGCGKTSLINKLIEILDLKGRCTSFNFAQLEERSNWEIEDMLHNHISDMNITSPIFVYDEFQYAKTIAENGSELSRPALKVFWELLDSGKIKTDYSSHTKFTIKRLYGKFLRVVENKAIVIEQGKIVSGENEYKKIMRTDEISSSSWSLSINENSDISIDSKSVEKEEKKNEIILSEMEKNSLLYVYRYLNPEKYEDIEDIHEDLSVMNKFEIMNFILVAHKQALENITMDFSKSLIFVLGNLDEAYTMVYSTNPDMSADQFHILSKDISIINIKKALQTRFRVEQIARLGNIHLIYPAFSSKTFKAIIKKELDSYVFNIKKLFPNFKFVINSSVNDIIYKDSVFPTHGARPIFTSIHEIVKTKLVTALMHASKKNLKYDEIMYSFKNNKFIITFKYKSKRVSSLSLDQVLRVEHLRESQMDDYQAIVAVHEAGHAVVSIVLEKSIPTKICSVSTDDTMGGFILPDASEDTVNSKQEVITTLATLLAGKVAEKFVYEKEELITNGCSMDYAHATSLASRHIRKCGFGKTIAQSGWMPDPRGNDSKLYDVANDKQIEQLLQKCNKLAENTISTQKLLFFKLAEYLSTNNEMDQELIREYVSKYYVGTFEPKNPTLYRSILETKLKNL